jgi:hypothetical protein
MSSSLVIVAFSAFLSFLKFLNSPHGIRARLNAPLTPDCALDPPRLTFTRRVSSSRAWEKCFWLRTPAKRAGGPKAISYEYQ